MRIRLLLVPALAGLAAPAPAQRFGFTHQMLPGDGMGTTAVALGDVDGDADLDVFAGILLSGNLWREERLYLNDGTGVLADVSASGLPAAFDDVMSVALGDVDGDGDLDGFLVRAGYAGAQDSLYLNGGTGVFTDVSATNLPPGGDGWSVAPGDVDGDGDLDVFVGNFGQDRLFLNVGTGVFADVTATSLPAFADPTTAVALGDVDGDGDLDAFVGNSGQQSRLLLNGGTGGFADVTATSLPAFAGPTTSVALGDVDGDGDLDAFVGISGPASPSGPSRLYLNGGAAVFTDATLTNLPAVIADTKSVALGDADGDGDLDAFVANGFVQQSRLYRNGGTGVFTDVTAANLPALNVSTWGVAVGDMDGDGDLDALWGNFVQDNRLHLNDGSGVFVDVSSGNLPALISFTWAVAFGDVDGDGDLDVFAGNAGQNRLFLNGGTGVLADVTATNLPTPLLDDTAAVALGDVDGDGDLDAFVGNGSAPNRLYLNTGTGGFLEVGGTNLPAQNDYTEAVALGDVDGDGDLDAFIGNSGACSSPPVCPGEQNRLYLNGGAGVFADFTATSLPALIDVTWAVALGDVDGDGDLDAFVGNGNPWSAGEQNRLYVNDGTGVFADATGTGLPGLVDSATAVSLGDVDGDGDLDAWLGNSNFFPTPQDRLYLNVGAGVFADVTATNLPAVLDFTSSVALGDVDGDGDLDALLGSSRLYRNDGTGVFTDVTATALPVLGGATGAVALGDIDGDGDLDAFLGAIFGSSRLLIDLSRQLAWRGTPRAGKSLTLELWGPASGSWLLAASAGTSNIPLPPFGTLRLLPSTLFVVTGGGLDPQGRASVSFLVPANPALVGLSFYWQAVLGPPFRFTNLEVTTVTNL